MHQLSKLKWLQALFKKVLLTSKILFCGSNYNCFLKRDSLKINQALLSFESLDTLFHCRKLVSYKSNPKCGYDFKTVSFLPLKLSLDTCLNFSIAFTKVFWYSRLFFSSSVVRATHSKSNKRRDVVKVTVAPKSCFDTNTREFFIEKR